MPTVTMVTVLAAVMMASVRNSLANARDPWADGHQSGSEGPRGMQQAAAAGECTHHRIEIYLVRACLI
jgi:hypothetical protein